MSSRIDLVGCPYSWLHHVVSCELLPCPFSDHSAVLFNSPIPEPLPRGPGRWKLNVSILSDSSFIAAIADFWLSWRLRKGSFESLQLWWDRGKEHIKSIAIRFCNLKSKEKSSTRSLLVNLSVHLKSRIDNGHVSLLDVFESVMSQIAALDLVAANGAKVRSRVRWAEEGEVSSSYFLRLEKKRGSEDWFSAMRNPDGLLVSDVSGICDSWVSFYSSLFSASVIDLSIQNDLLCKVTSRVPPSDVGLCEGHLGCW